MKTRSFISTILILNLSLFAVKAILSFEDKYFEREIQKIVINDSTLFKTIDSIILNEMSCCYYDSSKTLIFSFFRLPSYQSESDSLDVISVEVIDKERVLNFEEILTFNYKNHFYFVSYRSSNSKFITRTSEKVKFVKIEKLLLNEDDSGSRYLFYYNGSNFELIRYSKSIYCE